MKHGTGTVIVSMCRDGEFSCTIFLGYDLKQRLGIIVSTCVFLHYKTYVEGDVLSVWFFLIDIMFEFGI